MLFASYSPLIISLFIEMLIVITIIINQFYQCDANRKLISLFEL